MKLKQLIEELQALIEDDSINEEKECRIKVSFGGNFTLPFRIVLQGVDVIFLEDDEEDEEEFQ